MATLPAPKNKLVSVVNQIIDGLLIGIGEDLIILSATAEAPFLALPVVSWLFRQTVSFFVGVFDSALKKHIDKVIIRFQGDVSKKAYDQVMERFREHDQNGGPSDKDIEDAKKTADDIIRRGRR